MSAQLTAHSRVPMMPSLAPIIPLIELGKALSLLLPGGYKGYNAGTAKWKTCMGQGMGRGETWSLHAILNVLTNPALCTPPLGVFMEVLSCRDD